MVTISVDLDEKLDQELTALAESTGLSKDKLIRSALRHQVALAHSKKMSEKAGPFGGSEGWIAESWED